MIRSIIIIIIVIIIVDYFFWQLSVDNDSLFIHQFTIKIQFNWIGFLFFFLAKFIWPYIQTSLKDKHFGFGKKKTFPENDKSSIGDKSRTLFQCYSINRWCDCFADCCLFSLWTLKLNIFYRPSDLMACFLHSRVKTYVY